MAGGKPQGSKALRRIPSIDGHFLPVRSPQFILFYFPLQNLPPGIMCLGALHKLCVWEKNPIPNKLGLDSWLFSPWYDGNCGPLDALSILYFTISWELNQGAISEVLKVASGNQTQNEAGFVSLLKCINF